MVMKVLGANNIMFRSVQISTPQAFVPENYEKKITELGSCTRDYNVKLPVKYKKLAVHKLDNGMELYSYKMENGYKVTVVPMKGSPAVVKTYVNVGSMNETAGIKGISHFLEHMAFNGTNGADGHIELKQGDSFKKIDRLGGWANASTNYAITDYVNSSPMLNENDVETQIKVLAAMAEDLKLSEDMIAKEKGPVSSEINMILDNPQTIAMDQTVRTLFNIKNPADEMVGGSVEHIRNLTREKVLNYYNTYYTPDNTNIVITGDVNPEEVMRTVAKNFTSKKVSKGKKYYEKMSPITKTIRKDFNSNKAVTSEIVIGFAGPKNNDLKGKILYELATAYLMSHDAGLTEELKKQNTLPVISNEKISSESDNPRISFIMLNPAEARCEDVLKTVMNNLGNKKKISSATLSRLKQRIKQDNEDVFEHSAAVNDNIGYSMFDHGLEYITNYNKILDSITPDELSDAIKTYFDVKKAAITVIHPQNNNVVNTSFKGKERVPMDMNDVSEYKTKNNYDVAFYNTQSNNVNLSLKLFNNIPYTKKAGVIEVLNRIYKKGTERIEPNKFEEFKDKNNLTVTANTGNGGLGILMSGNKENLQKGLAAVKELLYHPNITEDSVKNAVSDIKEKMCKEVITSDFIQNQYDNKMNPYAFTRKEILDNLDSITPEDVRELHNFIVKNSRGIVTANVPKNSENYVKKNILGFISSLKVVEPNNYRQLEIYKELNAPVVLKIENQRSQADISQAFRFKYNETIKEKAVGAVLNSMLTSSSIGLFNTLREKENLAYSVRSDISSCGDQGKITLNILTTTDNKEIGEIKYDNVQKAIIGFNRQIKELTDGKFTDEDLENAKRSIKAALLNTEGNFEKMQAMEAGMDSKYNIELRNKMYKEIDKISKEDILSFGKEIFSKKPVYSITATKDTLDANKDFLENLKNI